MSSLWGEMWQGSRSASSFGDTRVSKQMCLTTEVSIEICGECKSEQNLASTMHVLSSRYHLTTNRLLTAQRICASCSSTPLTEHVKCDSIECPALYARVKASNEVDDTRGTEVLITKLDREARQKWPGEEIPPEVITLIDSDDD